VAEEISAVSATAEIARLASTAPVRSPKLYATETAFEVAHESLRRCTRKWADLPDVTGRFCFKLRETLVDFMLQANRQRPRFYVHR